MEIETNNDDKCEMALTGLYDVIDPEVNLNIVDLGLVYRILFYDDKDEISITMTLTTRFCPMGDSIMDATKQSLKQSFPEMSVRINLTFDPPWNPVMISAAGNEFLNG